MYYYLNIYTSPHSDYYTKVIKMTQTDMGGLGNIVNKALVRAGATLEQYDEGREKPPVLGTRLSEDELSRIRAIQDRYHKGEGATYEECMKAFYVHAEPEENGALFIDFPGSHYPNGLGLDVLPAHTHQAGRVVANIGDADGIFHVVDNSGRYREHAFQTGDMVAFTGNPHTFTTKGDLKVLAFHLPFYDLEKDPRALKMYDGAFGR